MCGISVVRENGEELPTFKDDELINKVKREAKIKKEAAAIAALQQAAAAAAKQAEAAKQKANKGAKKKTSGLQNSSSPVPPTSTPGVCISTALLSIYRRLQPRCTN